jgi:hypothetical protein
MKNHTYQQKKELMSVVLCYGLYVLLPQQEYVWGAENRGNILMHMWFILHFNSYTHWTYFTSLIFEVAVNWSQQIVTHSTKNPSSAGTIIRIHKWGSHSTDWKAPCC